MPSAQKCIVQDQMRALRGAHPDLGYGLIELHQLGRKYPGGIDHNTGPKLMRLLG